MMAGEQSAGTFVRVVGETEELWHRFGARVVSIDQIGQSVSPTLRSAWAERKGLNGPCPVFRVVVDYLEDNIGVNLPTLAAVAAGNLYDLGEITGLKLMDIELGRNIGHAMICPP